MPSAATLTVLGRSGDPIVGSLHEGKIGRFERGGVFWHDRKLSECARAQVKDAGEDGIACLEAIHATSHLRHDTR